VRAQNNVSNIFRRNTVEEVAHKIDEKIEEYLKGLDEDRANVEWTREAWNDMKRFSTGGTYINFLTEDEGPESTKATLGKGVERLAGVKSKWDPENTFRTNRNIKPL
jgi:hypothetical protein